MSKQQLRRKGGTMPPSGVEARSDVGYIMLESQPSWIGLKIKER